MKKLLSIVISLMLVFAAMPIAMVSADAQIYVLADYEENNGVMKVTNMNGARTKDAPSKGAYQGSYSYKMAPKSGVWDQTNQYVTSGYLKNWVKFTIPEDIVVTGEVGGWFYYDCFNNTNYAAFGIEMANGDRYFTKYSQWTLVNAAGAWTNKTWTSKTYYKLGTTETSLTLSSEHFAKENDDASRVVAVIIADGGTTDYDKNSGNTYLDYIYAEASSATDVKYTVSIDGVKETYEKGAVFTVPTPAAHYVYTDGTTYYYGGETIELTKNLSLVSEVETIKEVYTMDEGKTLYGATNYYGDALIKDVDGDNKLALKAFNDSYAYFQLPSDWSSKPYYKPVKISYNIGTTDATIVKAIKTISFTGTMDDRCLPTGTYYKVATALTYLPATVSFNVTEDMYSYKYITGNFYGGAWSQSNPNDYAYIDNVTITYEYDFDYVEPEFEGESTDVLATDEAASIRLGEVNGIRFYTTIDTEALATLVGDKEYEVGTLIAPKDIAGDYLTAEDDHIKVVYDMTNGLWEGNQVVGSIVNISESNEYNKETGNLARDFVARAYVLVDGVYYYSDTQSVRNLAAIADEYIAQADSGYADLDENIKARVDKWASAND